MFWIAPIQTPIIPVRRSPKYFQVSDSGPSGDAEVVVSLSGSTGWCAAEARGRLEGIDVTVITASQS
jgi:hypothetical protein